METLTYIGLALIIIGAVFYLIGVIINIPKGEVTSSAKTFDTSKGEVISSAKTFDAAINRNGKEEKVKLSVLSKTEWQNLQERQSFEKETKITLAPSKRLCEEAVKHMN